MLGVILGVGIIAAVFLFIAFKLDEEHGILRFAFIMFSMGLLFLIPASVIHNENVCEVVLNDTEIVGNSTYYDYTTYCYEENGTGSSFVKAVKYPYWLFIAYLIVYLFYRAATALGHASKNGRMSRFFKGFKK